MSSTLPDSSQIVHTSNGSAVTRSLSSKLNETASIMDFGAVGGNTSTDTNALVKAVLSLGSTGGRIRLPATANAYKFDPYTLADLGSGTNPIELFGDGWATRVEVASACANFITLNGAWSALSDFQIVDPNNFCTAALILTAPSSGSPSLERRIERVHAIGPGNASTATMLVNDGGLQLRVKGCSAQNLLGAFWNKGGGVDSVVDGLYALGVKYGVRLDADTYGHAENMTVRDATLLCTQVGARAVWVTDSLHCKFENVVGGQLGSGGIGLYMDGVTGLGSALTSFIDCYFEGSDTAPAMKSRGPNQRFHMIGGGIGQGGYAPSVINGIDFDGANGFVFDNVDAFFPNGNCNKVATFANSSGVVTATCKNWAQSNTPNTETACAIRWELEALQGVPPVRAVTSAYPQADWTVYTPTITSATGTISTLGPVSCAYRVDGKTVNIRINATITTNGTAATLVYATLPIAAKAGEHFILHGREDGLTGSALQGNAFGTGVSITRYDNAYPGGSGAVIYLTGTYEIG
jgi:hypothetical protein